MLLVFVFARALRLAPARHTRIICSWAFYETGQDQFPFLRVHFVSRHWTTVSERLPTIATEFLRFIVCPIICTPSSGRRNETLRFRNLSAIDNRRPRIFDVVLNLQHRSSTRCIFARSLTCAFSPHIMKQCLVIRGTTKIRLSIVKSQWYISSRSNVGRAGEKREWRSELSSRALEKVREWIVRVITS